MTSSSGTSSNVFFRMSFWIFSKFSMSLLSANLSMYTLKEVSLMNSKCFYDFLQSKFDTLPVRLMTPEPNYFCGRPDALVGGEQEALENVGQIPEVEDVMELDRRRHEHLGEGG